MERRKFLKALGASMIVPSVVAKAEEASAQPSPLKDIRRIRIEVGTTAPFKALHIADSHLTLADSRENQRKTSLAESRGRYFGQSEACLRAAVAYAEAHNMLLLHTGDVSDFVSHANLELAQQLLPASRCFMSAGNHEYSQYVGEAKEDEAYKAQSRPMVENAMPNNLTMASRIVNGVNFCALDDIYYNFTAAQLAWMKTQVKRGLPIVLMCHVPIYTPGQCEKILKSNNNLAGYVTGAPLAVTETYECDPNRPANEQWRNRSVQQRADQPTLDFIKWLKKQKLVKAVLCGHCHEFHQERLSPSAMQYTVGAGYAGAAYEVEFV